MRGAEFALPLTVLRNLQGILPASRILGAKSDFSLFTKLRGREFSEVSRGICDGGLSGGACPFHELLQIAHDLLERSQCTAWSLCGAGHPAPHKINVFADAALD
jgi:hypothetical protein